MALDIVKSSLNVEGKVFLVTGGAAGVGAGIVRALLKENASHVAFLDISEREGAALEDELLIKFGALRAKFIKCDIADEAQFSAAYKQILDKYRRLDAVINNAAVLRAEETSYKRMVDINFTATVSSTLKALDILGADKGGNGGTIVNMSSLLALQLHNHLPVYTATKAAVLEFSTSIGAQHNYAKTKVRILTVCLGPTDTAIVHRHNMENFDKDCAQCLTSHVTERQRVESAVTGIIEVIERGESGSAWMIANDKPAVDITKNINESFDLLCKGVHKILEDL